MQSMYECSGFNNVCVYKKDVFILYQVEFRTNLIIMEEFKL